MPSAGSCRFQTHWNVSGLRGQRQDRGFSGRIAGPLLVADPDQVGDREQDRVVALDQRPDRAEEPELVGPGSLAAAEYPARRLRPDVSIRRTRYHGIASHL